MLVSPLLLQVLVVAPAPGPGVDFTSLQAAIDAAASGDVVLVRGGTYSGALSISGKALTIVADAPAPPVIANGNTIAIQQVPAGATLALRGLIAPGGPTDPYAADTGTLGIGTSAGSVLVEDCTLGGTHSALGATNAAFVGLSSSRLVGATNHQYSFPGAIGAGAWSVNSLIAVHGTTATGGDGFLGGTGATGWGVNGAAGVVVTSGKLIATRSIFEGGRGSGSQVDGYAVCSYSMGGSGLVLGTTFGVGNPQATGTQVTTLAGITGPVSAPCIEPPAVPPVKIVNGTLTSVDGSAPLLSCSPVTREGQAFDVGLSATAGEFCVLLVATSVQPTPQSQLVGVLVNPAASVLPLGAADASGALALSVVLQELGAGVEGAVLYLQGASVDLATLTVRLSNVSVAVLVDAGL